MLEIRPPPPKPVMEPPMEDLAEEATLRVNMLMIEASLLVSAVAELAQRGE